MDTTAIIIASIQPVFGLLTAILTGIITLIALKINKKVDEAQKVNDATHILVNSNMGIQLKIAMGLANRLAKITKTPEDMADAIETKRIYDDHMNKQSIVDSR
jgi:hypothetical protein